MNIYDIENECPCCDGTGAQRNHKTGLKEICPCCKGTGKKKGEVERIKYYYNQKEKKWKPQ